MTIDFGDVAKVLRAAVTMAESPSAANALSLFETTVEMLLPYLPDAALKASLDETARKRVDAVADALEDAKFGPNE